MKPQKTHKSNKLEQVSTFLNQIDDSDLQQIDDCDLQKIFGGSVTGEYPFGVPLGSPGGPWTHSWNPELMEAPRMQRHNELN